MATAITTYPLNKKITDKAISFNHSVDLFVKKGTPRSKFFRLVKKVSFYLFILLVISLVAGTVLFYSYYNFYYEVVKQKINSGFWHSRAGVYSGPIKFKRGQNFSRAKVVELLKRAGYIEGGSNESIWNGNFVEKNEGIEVHNYNLLNNKAESVLINFNESEIVNLTNLKSKETPVESFEIESELLTGRSNSKRGKNQALTYEEIPEVLRNAILTAEDTRFFNHNGVDPKGIARAFFRNISEGQIKQGGSTITQQLVKNTFLSPEKSFSRKFSEMFLALALENQMSKEDIFTLYCNEIYLGQYGANGVHGVEEAALTYFDKDLKEINLNEAAAIAAMIKNPNHFAPHKNLQAAENRRKWIISQLEAGGFVSSQKAEEARNSQLTFAQPKNINNSLAPYFVDQITKELNTRFNRDYLNSNFNTRIYSTVDTELQTLAEQTVNKYLLSLDKIYSKKGLKVQASLVSMNPQTGEVLAMVGGRDYNDSQFNRAVEAKRQPGSVFKPIVYATALEKGASPAKVFRDAPIKLEFKYGKAYEPANYGKSYAMNNISLKTALAKSSNVVAIQTAYEAGLKNVAVKAAEFGFENIEPYPSMPLGTIEATPLQIAAAYSVFANGGKKVEPTFISKIVSGDDRLLYQSAAGNKEIINPKTAYMITDMLKAVVSRGTAAKAKNALGNKNTFAGKTGSSNDGWFAGYTPNLVTIIWVGLDENNDLNTTGGEIALPLWTDFMKSVVEMRPEFGGQSFKMPLGLASIEIDSETGMLAGEDCPHKEQVVVDSGYAPTVECFTHRKFESTFDTQNISVPQSNFSTVSDNYYEEKNANQQTVKPETYNVKDEETETITSEPNKVNNQVRKVEKEAIRKQVYEIERRINSDRRENVNIDRWNKESKIPSLNEQ